MPTRQLQESQRKAQALQHLQAKIEEKKLQALKLQHPTLQQSGSNADEDELLDDFSSPEKDARPSGPPPVRAAPKGLSRLKPASSSAAVDNLTSSLHLMQLSGSRQQTRGQLSASKSSGSGSSGGSSSVSDEETEAEDIDGTEGSEEDTAPVAVVQQPMAELTAPVASRKAVGHAGALALARGPAHPPGPDDLVLGDKYRMRATLHRSLYAHQVEGVKWLWSLFAMGRGGILGDDMGLGKTMQCAAFLAGLLESRLGKRALVIAPKTLLMHWHKELEVCGLGRSVYAFYGDSVSERAASLNAATGAAGGVLLTTYGMCLHNANALAQPSNPLTSSLFRSAGWAEEQQQGDFKWDMVILDEGHKVKNPKMKLVQQLQKIPSHIRVIISGTPIQNNLAELRNLMDFCCEGLLGSTRTFSRMYGKPITDGQDRNATAREREIGAAIAQELRRKIAPFFLRREKKDVLTGASSSAKAGEALEAADTDAAPGSQGAQQQAVPKGLSRKNDLVVWLRLKPLQRAVYEAFLHSEAVRRALNETDSPLAALTVLKKTCDHPALLSEGAAESVLLGGSRWAQGKGRGGQSDGSSDSEESEDDCSSTSSRDQDSDDSGGGGYTGKGRRVGSSRRRAGSKRGPKQGADGSLPGALLSQFDGSIEKQLLAEMESKAAEASCKSQFVLALLDELAGKGHRTLVFSQSRVMLDILQAGVKALGMEFCRIDGSIASAEDRQAQVRRFQSPKSTIPVFLLTSQVGGLGLTLTAADRVVIVDPSWNPAVDNQAVDRAYRIGQSRDVVVYRLITCGTVEEKIYSRQIFKGGLSRAGTEEGVQFRYFTQQQLRDLFTVTPEGLERSSTQQQLHQLHAHARNASSELQAHLHFLEKLECYAGISDHDLLFSCKPKDPAPSSDPGSIAAEYISRMKIGPDRERRNRLGSGGSRGGSSELQDMFGAAMRANASTAAAAASGQQLQINAQRRRVQDLQARVDSTQRTLANMSAMLPDGGSKLRAKQAEDATELAEAKAKLKVMLGQAPDAGRPVPPPLQQQPQQPKLQSPQPQQAQMGAQQQQQREAQTRAQQQQQQQALIQAQQQKQQAFLQQQQQRAGGGMPIPPQLVQQDGRTLPVNTSQQQQQQQHLQQKHSKMATEGHPQVQQHLCQQPLGSAPSPPSASSSGASSFVTAGSLSSYHSDSPGVEVTSFYQPAGKQVQPVPIVDLT